MSQYDFRTTRLYVECTLNSEGVIDLDRSQAHYLINVLRLKPGDPLLVFNGRDGEWKATLAGSSRKSATLALDEQTRSQTAPSELHYLFAPLKHARLDYMVQKAVEMGVSLMQPVFTRHSQTERINLDRMKANAVEAAEQCGILNLPEIASPRALADVITTWDSTRLLVLCDEDADVTDPVSALAERRSSAANPIPVSVLIGPEGGFAAQEREALLKFPNVIRLSLGPRILRADTAAVAALALVQAVLGDWK